MDPIVTEGMEKLRNLLAQATASSLIKFVALGAVTAYALYSVSDLKHTVERQVDQRLSKVDDQIEEYNRSVRGIWPRSSR